MKPKIKLVIFDLDNTLTTGPTIWELIHRENKTWKSHGLPFWHEFKQGKFGFNTFIRKDVACWKGLSLAKLHKAIKKMKYVHHIKKTILALKKEKIRTALVSSSVDQFARKVAEKFGIDYVFANPIAIRQKKLTGSVRLKVAGHGKGQIVHYLKKCLHLKKTEVLSVGDSHFDLPMFKQSGVTVTFTDAAKEVKQYVDHVINKQNIKRILSIIYNGHKH